VSIEIISFTIGKLENLFFFKKLLVCVQIIGALASAVSAAFVVSSLESQAGISNLRLIRNN